MSKPSVFSMLYHSPVGGAIVSVAFLTASWVMSATIGLEWLWLGFGSLLCGLAGIVCGLAVLFGSPKKPR